MTPQELPKRVKCSVCRKSGHNARTCKAFGRRMASSEPKK